MAEDSPPPRRIPTEHRVLDIFESAALAAGKAILEVYRAGPHVRIKGDQTPVTEADERAERIILAALETALPGIPVVAEESVAAGRIPEIAERFILVDPLDGTREFIGGHDDFTVNIALVENGVPVIGVVYAPALGVAYNGRAGHAEKLEVGANFAVNKRHPIATREPDACVKALVSRSHNAPATDSYLKAHAITDHHAVGSSLKFCLLAEGLADIYPRCGGRTMEWDTAAGDAVLRAAGGITLRLDGNPLTYGKRGIDGQADFANGDFVAWGRRPD